MAEIAKASKREAGELPNQAQFYKKDANNTVDLENIDSGEYL